MPSFTLTKQKTGPVVGLDIEAGSIAATEVAVNGSAQVTASAIGPLEPGAFHEGEVLDPGRLAAALKSLFAEHKLSKRVRLGIGNQRLVVRMMRLPAIEDPKEMEAAVRFQAQEQMPMPLDQAVLEHQVVGGVPAEEGSTPQVDVVVVAARREMVSSFVEPIRRAGLDPVGVDLSAFGMIRALAVAGAAPDGAAAAGEAPARPPPSSTAASATSPTSPWRGAGPASSPASPTSAWRRSRPASRARAGSAPSTRPSGSRMSGSRPRSRISRATPRSSPRPAAPSKRASARWSTSCASRSTTTAPRRRWCRSSRIVLCGPGSAIPGLSARMEAGLGMPIAVSRPAALDGFDPAAGGAAHRSLRPRPGGVDACLRDPAHLDEGRHLACAPST